MISGTTQDGQYLKVTSDGTWTSGDRLTYTYQWQRCDTGGANCANVPAASPAYFYKQTSGDIGHKIQVIVTATDAENQTGQSTSNLLGPVTSIGHSRDVRPTRPNHKRPRARVRASTHTPKAKPPHAHVNAPASPRSSGPPTAHVVAPASPRSGGPPTARVTRTVRPS